MCGVVTLLFISFIRSLLDVQSTVQATIVEEVRINIVNLPHVGLLLLLLCSFALTTPILLSMH